MYWDGQVYVSASQPRTTSATLIALSETDGTVVWQRTFDHLLELQTIAGGLVIVSAGPGYRALRADDGNDCWEYNFSQNGQPSIFPSTGYPVRMDDVLIVLGKEREGGYVAAGVAGSSGSERWRKHIPGHYQSFNHPAGTANAVLLPDKNGLEAVDPATGDSVWTLSPPAKPVTLNTPAVSSSTLVFSTDSLYGYSVPTGSRQWTQTYDWYSPSIGGEFVFGYGSGNSTDGTKKVNVVVIEKETGKVVVQHPLAADVTGAMKIAKGRIFLTHTMSDDEGNGTEQSLAVYK